MNAPAPKGLRLHISFFGRRNVGKSSLLNALTRQSVSIVSDVPGTTTDPVEKAMELLPLGPVLFIDTAGLDDVGALGELRASKTRQVFDRTEVGVLVAISGEWTSFEEEILNELKTRSIPAIVVFNKVDRQSPDASTIERLRKDKCKIIPASALTGDGMAELREALLEMAPADFINNPAILGDLVGEGEMAILVVPIDKEAPRGRLILPQVQSIRDILDHNAFCMVVKENELPRALSLLKAPPRLIVTDSQAFKEVAAITPASIPMTGFSVLMSRFKGDLAAQVKGAMAIDNLKPGDKVLVAEACTHHPIGEDIGRVKIPRWLNQYVKGELQFTTVQGHDFPADLRDYKLVVHCGACMWNRREMLTRIQRCMQLRVPITNYGLAIAYSLGIFDRALEPFPEVLALWRSSRKVVSI